MGDSTMIWVLVGLAATGTVFFLLSWLHELKRVRSLGYIEARKLEIEERIRKERQGSGRDRLTVWLTDRGYDGDPAPLVMTVTFSYLLISAFLTLLGVGSLLAFIIAVPVVAATTMLVLEISYRRRVERGTRQIMVVLRNVIGYLGAGSTPQQAFLKAANDIGNPLRADLLNALAGQVGAVGLGSVMAPLAEYYPDPATRLMIAALEVNDDVGAPLIPTLKQAEELIRKKTELSAEAVAEVSQARFEFMGITVVIGVIALMLLFGGGPTAANAYSSPLGIVMLSLGGLNFFFGVYSTLRNLARAKSGSL